MKKSVLFLTMLSFSAMATITENIVDPITLIKLKKDSIEYISICKTAGSDCKPGTIIWGERDSNDNFYLMPSSLKIIKLRKDNNGYSKVNAWDFSMEKGDENNTRGELKNDDLASKNMYIYPALYPLDKTTFAVALVSKWSMWYSGGGRVEEYADFMMLKDDGSYFPVFENISFSSKEMISACFTQEDYAKESHCHDENWSVLRLKMIDTGVAGKLYLWKFITQSYNWPAFEERDSIQMKTSEDVAEPFRLTALEI